MAPIESARKKRIGQAIDLLMEEGGPTLRYLTARDIKRDQKLARQLRGKWRDDLVSEWLARFKPGLGIHSGKDDAFETVTGKLWELGAHKDHVPLARRMSSYLKMLEHEPRTMLDNLYQILVASAGARLGFDLSAYASRRLRVLHAATREFDFDIYRPRDTYRLPPRYKNYPVIKERFATGGVFSLPYVHDLYLMNHVRLSRGDRARYLDVVRYVLDPRYQRLPHGFGYVGETSRGKQRWYVVGWKADFDELLIRQELMADLPPSLRTLPNLAPYEEGTGWLFPKSWLTESSPGYWVSGQRMALTAPPRRKRELKLESTFRAVRLLRKYQSPFSLA